MLQQEAGMTCTYTQAQAGERSGQHHLVFAYGDEEAGRYAAEAAVRLVAELIKADADPSADIPGTSGHLFVERARTKYGFTLRGGGPPRYPNHAARRRLADPAWLRCRTETV
jgi:hypothetical protein